MMNVLSVVVVIVAAGRVSADSAAANAQCAQSSCAAQMAICIADPTCATQFPFFLRDVVDDLPKSMAQNSALVNVAKCLGTATCVVRRAISETPSIRTKEGKVTMAGKDVTFSLESCEGVGSVCELAKAIETNLAAVAAATQAAEAAASDAKADATSKDAELKRVLRAEIDVLKETVTNDLTGRIAAVEQNMKEAGKTNAQLVKDLKATIDGDLGDATKKITSLEKNDISMASKFDSLTTKYDTLQKSVSTLEEASKCNFRGKLNKDGKKCTCSIGFIGDFCEKAEPRSCAEVLSNDGAAKDGLYSVQGKLVYCVMDKKWAGSGGWQVWTMFGDKGDFGAEVSKTTRKVRIKRSGQGFNNCKASWQGGFDKKMKSFNLGWSSNADYTWCTYCGAGRDYALGFHDSGGAVGEMMLQLPTGFTEFSAKYGNCYSGCSNVMYQAGKELSRKGGCGGDKRNCFKVSNGKYAATTTTRNLKWREQDGTCVGSIFWVLVR